MEQLGIQPTQLLFQAVNFLLMVILLTKFLYNPILKALGNRRKKIEEGLLLTQKLQKEEEKLELKKQSILDKGRQDAKEIINEARSAGKKVEQEIIKKAESDAAEIVEKGRRDVHTLRLEMEKDVKEESIEIAQMIVERVLSDVLSEDNQKSIINKKILAISKQIKLKE